MSNDTTSSTPPGTEGTEDARVSRTRSDVSRAALDVLTGEGWEAVTHAHVARIAGYSKTTLYTHWPSRFDLLAMALDCLGPMPHHESVGDLHTDLVGELRVFRDSVADMRLDRVLMAMAQWGASVDEIGRMRQRIVEDGEQHMRRMLGNIARGPALEAAVTMLSGVVVCPSLMYGTLPDDATIDAAVDIVLRGTERR
ncbi:MAG: TetR/AcrR family transcriptional regulator [Rhodococcus sp. (in: high G+C Gram-positive bacteria)]